MADKKDTRISDWVFKILSTISLPVFLWALTLQTTVSMHTRDIEEIRRDFAEMEPTKETTRQNSLAWTRLEESLKNIEGRITEIKSAIDSIKKEEKNHD